MKNTGNTVYYVIMAVFMTYAIVENIVSPNEYNQRVRLCNHREGVQVAKRIPAGKGRIYRDVILEDDTTMPYREWLQCEMVTLPSTK